MISKHAFESRVNVLLSELLGDLGIVSKSELLGKGRRDVVVYHQGLVCVLEGSYSKNDAEEDAKKRIEQLNADIALAVHYTPEVFPQTLGEKQIKERLLKTRLEVKLVIPEDISGTLFEVLYAKKVIARPFDEWYEFDLGSIATLFGEVGQFILSEEAVKRAEEEVDELISSFVEFLSSHKVSGIIAKNLYGVLYKLYGFSIGNPEEIKEAIFAQSILALLLSSIYYESIRYAHNLRPIKGCDSNPQTALSKAFEDILRIDYEEIFEASRDMVNLYPPSPRLFKELIELSSKIASQKTLLRRDFAGRIYHKVVGEWSLRKGLATYFTEIPSAYLLAYLSNPDLGRISDFACGSGTLLTATYSVINRKYRFSMFKKGIEMDPEEIEKEFHRKFLKFCYGFDVLRYATQITALNLALHSPETPLEDFNIYSLPLGLRREDKATSLGSLELVMKDWTFWEGKNLVEKAGLGGKEQRLLQELWGLKPFSFIIMNPPFTRATGRGGRERGGLFGFIADPLIRREVVEKYEKFREEVKKELLGEVKLYFRGSSLEFLLFDGEFSVFRNIGQAGEGLLFLYLADKMVEEGGKISFVLPKNFLSGVSWFLIRSVILKKYHIENVVVSYDSENGYNFSESTSLSECLFVAKKSTEVSDSDVTRFLLILRKPKTSIEAITLANKAEDGGEYIESGGARAFIVNVKRSEMKKFLDNWGRFVFLPNVRLLKKVNKLLKGVIEIGESSKKIPLLRLNDIITSIGIDRHQFLDNFEVVSKFIPGAKNIVFGGSEDVRRTMEVTPNAFAISKNSGDELFKNKGGKLLVPDRIWVDTAHIISMLSNKKTLSNIFYTISLKKEDDSKLKVLCFWLNTTWGILTILANKQETRGGWISLKISQWKLLPVLNVYSLSKITIKKLSGSFDKFKTLDLGRLPDQYDPKYNKLRMELDMAFLDGIGMKFNEESLLDLYEEIKESINQWLGK